MPDTMPFRRAAAAYRDRLATIPSPYRQDILGQALQAGFDALGLNVHVEIRESPWQISAYIIGPDATTLKNTRKFAKRLRAAITPWDRTLGKHVELILPVLRRDASRERYLTPPSFDIPVVNVPSELEDLLDGPESAAHVTREGTFYPSARTALDVIAFAGVSQLEVTPRDGREELTYELPLNEAIGHVRAAIAATIERVLYLQAHFAAAQQRDEVPVGTADDGFNEPIRTAIARQLIIRDTSAGAVLRQLYRELVTVATPQAVRYEFGTLAVRNEQLLVHVTVEPPVRGRPSTATVYRSLGDLPKRAPKA